MGEPRKWWTDGEFISNHMDESEEQLKESGFFQVVKLEQYQRLERALAIAKDKESQFSSTLQETMRVRDEKIAMLERALQKCKYQRNYYAAKLYRHDDVYTNKDDAEIEAITKGDK